MMWGSERALLDLLRHVDRSRFEIVVASPLGAQLGIALREIGVRTVHGPIGRLHRRGLAARVRAMLWMARLFRRYRPDVIHVNEAGASALVSAARYGLRIPVVAHVRLWEDAVRLHGRRGSRTSPDISIAVSGFIASALEMPGTAERTGVAPRPTPQPEKIRVIYDPFDAVEFCRAAGQRAPSSQRTVGDRDEANILMVGRICREKGQDLFLQAALRLRDMDVSFTIAGGVPPEDPIESAYYDALLRFAAQPALRNRVEFLGNRDDVAALIGDTDAVVVASRNEPFGRVLLEALALEVPVIAPDRGGPVEIVGNGERGFLFTAGSAESLANTIRELLSNRADARERSRRGREWVISECEPEKHARRVEAVWVQLGNRVTEP